MRVFRLDCIYQLQSIYVALRMRPSQKASNLEISDLKISISNHVFQILPPNLIKLHVSDVLAWLAIIYPGNFEYYVEIYVESVAS